MNPAYQLLVEITISKIFLDKSFFEDSVHIVSKEKCGVFNVLNLETYKMPLNKALFKIITILKSTEKTTFLTSIYYIVDP